MPTSAAGFLLGILALLSLPVLPALDGAAPALLLLAAALGVLRATSRPLAFAILGFLHAHAVAGSVLSNRLPHDLEGVVLDLEGEVATLPSETPLRSRFEFTVEHAATAAGESLGWGAGARVRLSWYERRGVPRTRLRGGERLTLRVKLRRPRGLANPAGFDYERWLFAQRIAATGYVVGARLPERLETGFGLTALRAELAARLRQQAANVARPAMLEALTLGARGGLDAGEWQQLRDTGTGHLVAISGLHVGMLALLGYAIARRGWALSARLTQWVAAPRAAAVLALLLAASYAALAGFTLPTQRALAMVAVVMVAIWTRRRVSAHAALGCALLLVLLLDALAPLSAGFWLSFWATAVLLFLVVGRRGGDASRLRRMLLMQLAVALGLAPVALAVFGQQPMLSPVANLLAIPWTGWVIVPLALLGSVLAWLGLAAAGWPLWLAGWAAEGLFSLLELLAGFGNGWQLWRTPSLFAVLAAMVGVLLLMLPRGASWRWLGVLWLTPLWLPQAPSRAEDALQVAVLDVGQGLAVVVSTAAHTLVYDTGPAFAGGFDSGRAVLLPYLRALAVERIDVLILSHANADHTGGAASLLAALPVQRVLYNEPRPDTLVEPCTRGLAWRWDGYEFRILHPRPGSIAAPVSVQNDGSCVLRINGPAGSVLLPGDLEAGGEAELLAGDAELAADVMLVGHHGSRTSSTASLVASVKPRLAVFATGYRNRYGFPAPDIAARWWAAGAQLLDTASDGALLIDLVPGRESPRVRRMRRESRMPWHEP